MRVTAPAKVNLFLGIGAARGDGYHVVVTVVHPIGLADELTIEPSSNLSLSCEPDLGIPAEQNLGYRAAVEMGREYGREPNIAITVNKRIPAGAGLGGGSSDAAGVILALARMWGVSERDERCLGVARLLGADVPMFLLGGCALLEGRGDILVRTLRPVDVALAIVKPPASVPTASAYSAFDAKPIAPGPTDAVVSAVETGDAASLGEALSNNMVSASVGLVPAIGEAIAWMRAQPGVLGATMSGSGSAVFAVCKDDESASRIAADAIDHGWWGVATRTRAEGATVHDEEDVWQSTR